jgi:GNAT superfamily N-acetyltransferase
MSQFAYIHPTIRLAQLDEAETLSDLAFRSKAHWGYSADFMEAARSELRITPEQLTTQRIFVLEQAGQVMGFYKLREVAVDGVELTDLFIDPAAIGRGWGRLLWEHAVTTARRAGYLQMTWESDPYAEGFYLHMGAQRTGQVESTVKSGRFLPRMRYTLRANEKIEKKTEAGE